MTPNRIAPKAGYSTAIKANYRDQVWDAFAPGVADIVADTTGTLKAVIMPSAEGLEIEVALARGLREDQIVCVDRSAAVIATSKWRKRWPGVKFFASEVSAVGEKIAKAGWSVRVANLDLCGNFSDDTIDAVRGFLSGAPLAAIAALSVTIAKGREGSALTSLLKAKGFAGAVTDARMGALFHMAGVATTDAQDVQTVAEGAYTSGRQPMAWCVVALVNLHHFREVAWAKRQDDLEPLRKLIDSWHSEFEIIRVQSRRGPCQTYIRKYPSMAKYIEIEHLMQELSVSDRERAQLIDGRPKTGYHEPEDAARFHYAHAILRGETREPGDPYYLHSFWHRADCAAGTTLEKRVRPSDYYREMLKKGYCRPAATKALLLRHEKGKVTRGWGRDWLGRDDIYVLSCREMDAIFRSRPPLSPRRY